MKIIHKDHPDKGTFYLVEGQKVLGEIDYVWVNDSVFAIVHTEVNPLYRGEGYAKQLVDACAQYARDNNLKIIPICAYAKAVMLRTDAYDEVLLKIPQDVNLT